MIIRATRGLLKGLEPADKYTVYQRLIFNCPLDKEYQVEIFGKFYSIPVSNTALDNWWVLNFSETVLAAALYKMQLIFFKNSEGAKDYLSEVQVTTGQLNYDQAEQEGNAVSRMDG